MTDYLKYINALRKCAKEHENDRTSTGHVIVSDLCRDTANLLEELSGSEKPNKSEIPTDSTTKNCKSCEYYGSHHKVCNYCYKSSLWTEKEPTPKNDCETCIHNKGVLECDMYGCKYEPITKNDLAVENLKILKENYWDDDGYGHETKQYDDTMLALDMAIKALELKTGHWIDTSNPKADYEARLKADMAAMLTEIQLEIEELQGKYSPYYDEASQHTSEIIQQKIRELEENQ